MLAAVAEGRHSRPALRARPARLRRAGDARAAHRRSAPGGRSPRASTAVFDDGTACRSSTCGHGVWAGAGAFGPERLPGRAPATPTAPTGSSDDPYRFAPTIGELDLHLIGEGRHEELWRVLGAHYRAHWGVDGSVHGTAFTVWAPHARAVRVVGDFNRWDGTGHAMRTMGAHAACGSSSSPASARAPSYKFELLTAAGDWIMKADPMARYAEVAAGDGVRRRASPLRAGATATGWRAARGRRPARRSR